MIGSSGCVFRPTPAVAVSSSPYIRCRSLQFRHLPCVVARRSGPNRRSISGLTAFAKGEDGDNSSGSSSTSSLSMPEQEEEEDEEEEEEENYEPDPQDLKYASQIRRVLELLKKNRDMLFNEVKLTIMIEDPRDVERRRLLGIDDEKAPTRDDLADALVQVNEGKIPRNRAALQMLAEEMLQWPNLEVEPPKKNKTSKSPYARITDTGIDPREAAKRLNVDWDSAAEIEEAEADNVDVPPALL